MRAVPAASRPATALARALAITAMLAGASRAQAPTLLAHDVPRRGALVYERTTDEFDVAGPPTRLRMDDVLADGGSPTPHEWRYLECTAATVPANFEQPGFADTAWTLGRGKFGPDGATNPQQRTVWRSEVLCARTTLPAAAKKPRALVLTIDHDDGVRVWLNGKLVVADDGYGYGRTYIVMGNALDAWTNGANVLAARCTNTGGAQHFDLGVQAIAAVPANVRNAKDLQELLRGDREQGDRVQRELFGHFRPPPLLLEGELCAKRQSVVIPPSDLRELGWWLAMDLRIPVTGGGVQADAYRMLRLGDLDVRGRASAVDPEGWQTLDLTVRNLPDPLPRGDSKRYLDRHVRPFVWYGVDGKLRVRRRLDVASGKARVTEFTTEFDARIVRGKDGKENAGRVVQRERWKFREVRENQDAGFRAMVAAALEKGVAKLHDQLRDLRAPDIAPQADDAGDSYHAGRLAVGLMALVKGGVPKDDPVVVAGYAELRRRKLIDTYSLASAIMAIEALYTPATEASDLRSGALARAARRQPTPDDLALLQRWAAQLRANVDTRVDSAYLLRFNYTAGERFDNSVNQYGLLGLWSAHLCGVTIEPIVWEAAANHLIASQSTGGAAVRLDLVDFASLARRRDEPMGSATRGVSKANGWSYHEPKLDGEATPTWGSMTCAGITGLAICEAALLEHPALKRTKLLAEVRRARDDGFAWLAQWMTVRHHAGAIERQQHWHYYYLYSLERAALLSGIAWIQDRDWYFEGAMMLVYAQLGDGGWPGELEFDAAIERNAMAILFCKQSTSPVVTGR